MHRKEVKRMVIINAKINTCDGGKIIEHGFIEIKNGRITGVLIPAPKPKYLTPPGGWSRRDLSTPTAISAFGKADWILKATTPMK